MENSMNDLRVRIIEKAIENRVDVATTKEYLKLLERTDYHYALEVSIGTFAEMTGNYKTICQRCNELDIKTVGQLVRYGGRKMRESSDVGAKTAALISDTLQREFGIDNWFSKECEL